ncbi:MAG: type III secretion system chaperone [Candidatus Competibacteraceae bacterium]|nr:type III secretion system chaperone [Candidatus Competibacteraceae bacterium]
MSKENIHQLVKDFGREIGLADMAMDENDFVCLFTNDGVVLNLDYHEDEDVLVMYTTVGEIPDDKRLQLYQELLQANFFWESTAGATMCVDHTAERVMLMANITVSDLDLPKLMAVLDHFTGLAWAWSDRIRELVGQEANIEPPKGDAPPGMFDPSRLA